MWKLKVKAEGTVGTFNTSTSRVTWEFKSPSDLQGRELLPSAHAAGTVPRGDEPNLVNNFLFNDNQFFDRGFSHVAW